MLNHGDSSLESRKSIYLGWLPKEFIDEMQQKVPGLYEKLSNLCEGDNPNLTETEKAFFVNLVTNRYKEIGNIITGLAAKVWGAYSAYWTDPVSKTSRQENIAAAFWWDFCSSNLEISRVSNLVEFYLGTTKEEAEKQASERHGYPIRLK
ncbi:hypothetical protein IT412_02375 [Candidatus Peregrinibacteria bacterium]|nr:hypothetical protein [Candidatus Peregrinibacteria bacterium]